MKEKAYDPARHNESSPAPGFASVNTFSGADGEVPEGEATEKNLDRETENTGPSNAKPADGGTDDHS